MWTDDITAHMCKFKIRLTTTTAAEPGIQGSQPTAQRIKIKTAETFEGDNEKIRARHENENSYSRLGGATPDNLRNLRNFPGTKNIEINTPPI